jgi:type I restriction enzyme S subunit
VSWPLAALGDIAPAKPIKLNGYTPSDRIWHVTLDQIESNTGRLLEKSIKPLSEAGSSTHVFDDRHVLYSKLRPYLNKVLLPDEIGLGTTELVPMLPASGKLDRVYLAHYLKSKTFVNWISSQTAGAKMPRVSMNTFWEHEIPLPPLTEQKRIAAILDKADSLRRKNQQAIQLADQFLHAVFLEMFGDPVTNPKGWDIKSVVEISTRVTKGESPKWQGFGYEDHGVRFITSENVLWGQLDYRYKYISEKFNEKLFRSQICEGDLLINLVGASVGRVCLATKESLPANINQAVSVITLNPGILLPEIALRQILTSSIQQKLLGHVVDAARANISLTNIRELELVIPPMEKQFEFLTFIKKINSAMEKQKLTKNLPFFDTLSQKAFAGEL